MVSIIRWIKKCGTLSCQLYKENGSPIICSKTDGTGAHDVEWSKLDTEKTNILFCITCGI